MTFNPEIQSLERPANRARIFRFQTDDPDPEITTKTEQLNLYYRGIGLVTSWSGNHAEHPFNPTQDIAQLSPQLTDLNLELQTYKQLTDLMAEVLRFNPAQWTTSSSVQQLSSLLSGLSLPNHRPTEQITLNISSSQEARQTIDSTHSLDHDVKSPFAAIYGALQLIQRGIQRGNHDRIPFNLDLTNKCFERLYIYSEEGPTISLLDLLQQQAAEIEIPIHPLSGTVVSTLIGTSIYNHRRNHPIEIIQSQLPAKLEAEYIKWSMIEIDRLVQNIVVNLYEHQPNATLTVSYTESFDRNNNRFLSIIFEDNGGGLPDEIAKNGYTKGHSTKQAQSDRARGEGMWGVGERLKMFGGQLIPGNIFDATNQKVGARHIIRLPIQQS